MALTDENNSNGMVMPVQPMGYGGNIGGYGNGGFGFGGDWAWILLLLLIGGNGWGMGGFGGGYGAMMGMDMMGGFGLYPWLNNSQNINDGFREQMLNTTVQGIQNSMTAGFGDVQLGIAGINQNICQTGSAVQNSINQGFANTNLGMCQGFNGVNTAIFGAQNAISQQMNSNEIANLNRSFAEQTANAQGFNGLNAGVADLRYTVATEACADRAAVGDALQNVTMQNMGNTNAIVNAINAGIQSIKDDLCADRLDAERRENQNLRSELMYARGQASQVEQTAQLRASQATTANQLVSELRSCPIPSQPVYGNQPIFTCPQNQYSPCGCNGNSF